MADQHASPRNPNHGIVLIATLVSLILVVGFTMVVQSAAIANTRVLKRITAEHQAEFDKASVRELLRPIIGEGMVSFDENGGDIAFNGTPFEVEFEGHVFEVSAQDVDGLVNPFQTPESLMKALLPQEWAELARSIAQSDDRSLPLELIAAQAGATDVQIRVVGRWLTREGRGRPLNALSLANKYLSVEATRVSRNIQPKQIKNVILTIESG